MTREEFSKLVVLTRDVCLNEDFIPTKEAENVWYSQLKDISYERAKEALGNHIRISNSLPLVADFRKTSESLNESEAWKVMLKAINNIRIHEAIRLLTRILVDEEITNSHGGSEKQ